jgi:hypothetical protein
MLEAKKPKKASPMQSEKYPHRINLIQDLNYQNVSVTILKEVF